MENSMKKLILVAAALMLLSVSLMGITFSINVINWKPGTEVTISGWVGIGGGGNWTVLPNLPMEKVGPTQAVMDIYSATQLPVLISVDMM